MRRHVPPVIRHRGFDVSRSARTLAASSGAMHSHPRDVSVAALRFSLARIFPAVAAPVRGCGVLFGSVSFMPITVSRNAETEFRDTLLP